MSNHSDSRRRFMGSAAGVASTIAVLPRLAAAVPAPPGATPAGHASTPSQPSGYQTFGPAEAAFVEAMVNVMCPADALTPAGTDCGLAIFFDRQLAGGFGKADHWYLQGPWSRGKPQQGIQVPFTPEEFFKAGLHAANNACVREREMTFDQLAAPDANTFLLD